MLAVAIVLAAVGLSFPMVIAQVTNPTAAPDFIVDASVVRTEHFDVDGDGLAESAPNVSPVVAPAASVLRARTQMDLTVANLSVSPGSGYGYLGAETVVHLVNATSGATISNGAATVYNAGAGLRNATYPAVTFPGPGLYHVKAGATIVAILFVHPGNDVVVSISPPSLTYSTGAVVYTITASTSTGPAGGYALSGANIPAGTTTLADGTRTIVGPVAGAGKFAIHASLTNAGTQSFGGKQLPDVRSNGTLQVDPQTMSVTSSSSPTQGTQVQVTLRPMFDDVGTPMLRRTSSEPMRADWLDASDTLNVTVTTPAGVSIRVNLTHPAAILPTSGWLDLIPYALCGSGPCGGIAPRVFAVDTTAGELVFAPGEDDGPLTNVWAAGSYHFRFEANTAGAATTEEEYAGVHSVSAVPPSLLVSHSPQAPHATGSITLFVNSSSGGPVGGASLAVRRNDVPYADLTTNVSGVAVLSGLASGSYTVNATASGYSPGYDSFEVTPVAPVSRVEIANVSGGLLTPVTVPIRLTEFTDLGTITLNLSFNATVVRVDGVAPASFPGGNVTWNVNNSTGTLGVLFTTSAIPGPSGSFVLVNVTLQAIGTPGALSPLDLTTIEAYHSDGTPLDVDDVDGVFRAGIVGDVNLDDLVDAADVQLVSRYVVGLPASITLANADANRDGRVSGVDAMFMAQYVAGTRTAL